MPSRKALFTAQVEAQILGFLEDYENYVESCVRSGENPENRRHYQKLKNYTHNIFKRRAGLETETVCFGSRIIGTSTPTSDLDLYVHAAKPRNVSERDHAIEVLKKVRRTMTKCKIWKPLVLIAGAKVPIFRVVFLPLELTLDIVACNPIGIYDSEMFRHIMELQPEAKHFFYFIRKWINDINDIRMKKMIIFYLTVFYLQRVRVLPTLENVHKGVNKKFVEGWEVQFDGNRTIDSYRLNDMGWYQDHIIGFFKFYGSLNFDTTVIDMYSGRAIPRRDYKMDGFEINSNMCVSAPLDRDRNVAHLVGKGTLEKFKKVCFNSAEFLKQNPGLLTRREE